MSYMYPFPRDVRVSQKFGANATKYNLSGKHTGEDAAVPVGTPVHAAGDGGIVAAGYFPNYNNEWLYGPMGGLTLVLDCGNTEPTFGYAHLSRVLVKEGDWVRKGQVVALSGQSGAATGPHTHTEALPPNWNTYNGTYGRVDPRIYMTEFPGGIAAQGTITPSEEDALTPDQMYELKRFIQDDNERRHTVTRNFVTNELAKKIDDSAYSVKVFTQKTDNENTDRAIIDNREVEANK